MQTKDPNKSCTSEQLACGALVSERNRYFTGKYMAARDFQADQDYFLSHHRLHNRLFHGWGIVCGLEVIPHGDPSCRDRWVILCPGIAIDCCGRELVIEKKTPIQIWEPPTPTDEEKGGDAQTAALAHPRAGYAAPGSNNGENGDTGGGDDDENGGENGEESPCYLLYIHYAEEKVEYVPALYAEGECDPNRQEANRIREQTGIGVAPCDEIENSGWRTQSGDTEICCRDDCADPVPGPVGVCLEPECPDHHMVPLALIWPRPTSDNEYLIDEAAIDTGGQRHLPLPADYLTHIVGINWPHGGEMELEHLAAPVEEEGMGRRLEIRFDRKLFVPDAPDTEQPVVSGTRQMVPPGTGVSAYTFVVEYGGVQQDIEYLPYDGEHPPGVEDDCVAVFTIDPDYVNRRSNIGGNMVYVTLKCNFILDCHKNPVDGDHLGGRLPSGNGTPGGVFESWFYVS